MSLALSARARRETSRDELQQREIARRNCENLQLEKHGGELVRFRLL
jgi:hypothetical protein